MFPFILLALQCLATPNVDLTNADSVTKATLAVATNLFNYYTPNSQGALVQNGASDASGVQWYEVGIMWESLMRTSQLTSNPMMVDTIAGALVNASFGPTANFLGDPSWQALVSSLLGKWNDDLAWWGMGPITGAEVFSTTTIMPGGDTFLKLARSCSDEIWQSWDEVNCGGGIFWTRDRSAAQSTLANYKSTITNAQYVSTSARLYILTGNQTYLDRGVSVYKWLRTVGLADPSGKVFDGGNAPNCHDYDVNAVSDSYLVGQLVEGLSNLYRATKDQSYLNDAQTYCNKALQTYALNNVIRDQCEPSCPVNRVSPKGILLRGLGSLYPLANDATKASIKLFVTQSLQGMLKTCNDSFACGNNWGSEGVVYSDFHTQMNALELMNAAMVIYAPRTTPTKFSYGLTTVNTNSTVVQKSLSQLNYSFSNFAAIIGLSFTVLCVLF